MTSRRYRVDEHELHVREQAGDREPPCVLLHGMAVSHRYLMPTAEHLTGRRVLVPDMPGFGLSSKPRHVLDTDEQAAVIADWLDQIGLRQVCLLGNSWGCQIAVTLAVTRPDLVSALVLVGPTADPHARTAARQSARWLRSAVHEELWEAKIMALDVRDSGPRRIFATLRALVRDRIEEKLPLVRVPTLMVRGQYDRVAPQRWLTEATALVPGARMLEIRGASHNAITTHGREVAAGVDALLSGSGPEGRTASSPTR